MMDIQQFEANDPSAIQLRPGHRLWSSCAGEYFGVITGVNQDGTVDLRVFDPRELDTISSIEDDCEELDEKWDGQLNSLGHALVSGVRVVRFSYCEDCAHPDWARDHTGWNVELDTPGNGCYRCTKLFSVCEPDEMVN